MKSLIEVELNRMAFGGDAIGQMPDGRLVFVPYGTIGEKALIEVDDDGQSFCRGKIVEILKASPERIKPRCSHFGTCGGCHYQFLPYSTQTRVKQQIVSDQLRRIGKFENPPIKDIIPSPSEWNYRNIVQFALSSNGKAGYLKSNSKEVVEITECFLPTDGINALWPGLDLDPESGLKRIILREGLDGDLLLTLEGTSPDAPEFEIDFPLSVVYQGAGYEQLLSGDPFTIMKVKEQEFRVSSGSFFQVNLPQAEKMVDLVLDGLNLQPSDTVLDCFCGVGLFSKFMAPRVQKLVGVEISESACDDFAFNLDSFENVELYMGSAQQILPGLDLHPNVVVVDPPRAGLEKAALEAVLKMKPERLAYVSCDPSTLARDLRRFIDKGYKLDSVTPLDLFPQTYHVECVALMSRAKE